jgi:aminoglycoside phosphotransferase family enzyme/predicted kinase
MPQSDLNELVRWLSDRTNYDPEPAAVEHVETHISHVFLVGDEAYKLKKPLKFDFLDFLTLAAREEACREEVRLNQRLAPGIYLGVVPVTREPDGGLTLDGRGEVVEWLVHMRRLPTELSLADLHQRGELRPLHVDRLAEVLVKFYRDLPPEPITAKGYIQQFLHHVRANFLELRQSAELPQPLITRLHQFQLRLLLLRPEVFAARVAAGKIVDGHGDLRPEHIILTDPPAIFDCIEFNAEFRRIDVADELAFLSAECDLIGADWAGEQLKSNFQRQTNETIDPELGAFYKTYRACVRAKVADLRGQQTVRAEHVAAEHEALAHLQLADRYSAPFIRPLVVAIGGLSGNGKSTVARQAADALGAIVLRTDDIRQELFAADPARYSPAAKEAVYTELFRRAAALLADGLSFILDATFENQTHLAAAQQLASAPPADFLAVECVCSREEAHRRIRARQSSATDSSEATTAIHDRQRESWKPWPTTLPHVKMNTEQSEQDQWAALVAALRQQLEEHHE